jgi:hypothetical protein
MGPYSLLESFNNQQLFRNIVITIIFIFFFMKMNIGLNILLGLFFAFVCVIYLYEKETTTAQIEKEQYQRELESIKPEPQKIRDNKDIIDFLFSVQDFYVFNPQAYEEMIDNLDAFKSLQDNIFGEPKLSNYYYQIAESKKENALNAFHSLIFTLPTDKIYTEKFDRAHERLETILNNYLNEMYDQCVFYLNRDGRDVYKREILLGPKEYNNYFDKDFTYQFY